MRGNEVRFFEKYYIHDPSSEVMVIRDANVPVSEEIEWMRTHYINNSVDCNYMIGTQQSDGHISFTPNDPTFTNTEYYQNCGLIYTKVIVPMVPSDGREARVKIDLQFERLKMIVSVSVYAEILLLK